MLLKHDLNSEVHRAHQRPAFFGQGTSSSLPCHSSVSCGDLPQPLHGSLAFPEAGPRAVSGHPAHPACDRWKDPARPSAACPLVHLRTVPPCPSSHARPREEALPRPRRFLPGLTSWNLSPGRSRRQGVCNTDALSLPMGLTHGCTAILEKSRWHVPGPLVSDREGLARDALAKEKLLGSSCRETECNGSLARGGLAGCWTTVSYGHEALLAVSTLSRRK